MRHPVEASDWHVSHGLVVLRQWFPIVNFNAGGGATTDLGAIRELEMPRNGRADAAIPEFEHSAFSSPC